jgi:hypothetical protein
MPRFKLLVLVHAAVFTQHLFIHAGSCTCAVHLFTAFCHVGIRQQAPTTSASHPALQEAAVPFAPGTKMMGCMYGPGHDELLQQDMRNTAALGVQVSATIQVGAGAASVRTVACKHYSLEQEQQQQQQQKRVHIKQHP